MTFSFLPRTLQQHLQSRPLVVGTLIGSHDLHSQIREAVSSRADLIEVRLDTFRALSSCAPASVRAARSILAYIKTQSRRPLLLTLRHASEAGAGRKRFVSDPLRKNFLSACLSFAALIDVEVKRAGFARAMTALAHRHQVGVIHSAHNFSGFSRRDVARLYAQAKKWKADLFKAAITPKTDRDLASFLMWGRTLTAPKPVLIAMGNIGFPSRIVGYTFGSQLTYGHLGRSAAPGQSSARDLRTSVDALYGAKR